MGCSNSASVGIQTEIIRPLHSARTSEAKPAQIRKRGRDLPSFDEYPVKKAEENHQGSSSWSAELDQSKLQTTSSNKSDQSTNTFINVLLLGQSGVGKSTFINAIVNYLTFNTFEEARSNQPVALMPVSFLLTIGDKFEERIIKYGDKDANEDHHHPGQSVTQQCRSYVFTISARTKLRLIDTPGMGDTRGLEQDDLNMHHILSFINNLSHLNAICILLKPMNQD